MEDASQSIEAQGVQVQIGGWYNPSFRPVVEAFIDNFKVEDEVGAACSIVVEGETVVDIFGGFKDSQRSRAWEKHSTVCMMSVAKGITAIAFNMLVDRGLVDLDAPVARYWPEFAHGGKEEVLVRSLLDHTAAIPVLTTNILFPGAMFDRETYIQALAEQEPLWIPGTRAAYHVHNMGYLLGEVMNRVDGRLVGQFIREEICGPLSAEYYIGQMTAQQVGQVAEIIPNLDAKLIAAKDAAVPETDEWTGEKLRAYAFLQNPLEPWAATMNSAVWKSAEIASANGHGNARGVALIYGALVGGSDGSDKRLMSKTALERMIGEQHNQVELLQDRPYRQALGVLLNTSEAVYMGPNSRSFGHHGIGGSIGFADPDAGIGFSYCCNKMHAVGDNGPRARRLIDALYLALYDGVDAPRRH